MKKIKKMFFIGLCIMISAIAADIDKEIFIITPNHLLPLLFTLLGLCITAYTFIYSPIVTIIKKNNYNEIKDSLNKLLNSFEKDMLWIFASSIVIILIDIVVNCDIVFIKDVKIELFNIKSLKIYLCNLFIALSASLSFYALYDIIKATFKILKNSFKKN